MLEFITNCKMFVSDKLIFIFIFISSIIICSLGQSSYCPSSSYLSPYCNCTSASTTTIIMDCSNVETEDQLKEIFTTAPITYTHMKELRIENNDQLKYLTTNVFGSVTFEMITFYNDIIEYIDEQAFSNSKLYLKEWYMNFCPFIALGFPFSSLNTFSYLSIFHFENSGYLSNTPRIHSNSMTYLRFWNTGIGYLPATSFYDVPNLKTLYLNGNNIYSLPLEILNYCPKLTDFYAGSNKLTKVSKDDFRGSNVLLWLNINDNEISTIEAGSFTDLKNGLLNLNGNRLTTLDESWLRSVLENQNEVDIFDNPLECGCDMAWLINDKLLKTRLDAKCENGTDIHDLDPLYFNTTCSIEVKRLNVHMANEIKF